MLFCCCIYEGTLSSLQNSETVAAKRKKARCQRQVTPRCPQPCSVKHLWVIMAGKHGANQLDVSALSCEQQQTLRHFKIKTRIANESYLMSHPEVDVMVGDFVSGEMSSNSQVCIQKCFFKGPLTSVSLLQITSPTQTFTQVLSQK
ncbi:hypothetical protein JOB18_034127 [Solea senegalensis]|uniref:Uncharacterized protein n=1 Tax=Solea senegalensis TaxID=28829 RepID=A0AAV6PWW4_SOLSE|nr:hypothetical protein JOB18_034127 [Solea senegalensis]